MKTAESEPAGHRVDIRVERLRKYMLAGVPTYYVVPLPPWSGTITGRRAAGLLANLPLSLDRTDMGFTRVNDHWFGR